MEWVPSYYVRSACPCGDYAVEVAGPEIAWSVAEIYVRRHGETCAKAAEKWTVRKGPDPIDDD
jgi:hypothetical protein